MAELVDATFKRAQPSVGYYLLLLPNSFGRIGSLNDHSYAECITCVSCLECGVGGERWPRQAQPPNAADIRQPLAGRTTVSTEGSDPEDPAERDPRGHAIVVPEISI